MQINKLIIFLIAALFIFQCNNPFATREAEPPISERSFWEPPSDPVIVLQNLQRAIAEKNVENYMRCLVDSNHRFHFIPDELVAKNNPGFFDDWDLAKERYYIYNAFNAVPDDSIRKLILHNLQRSDFLDSVLVKGEYILELRHTLGETVPQKVEGRMDFWLAQDKGYWIIYRWVDFGTVDSPSWSSLKANFGK